MRHSANLDLLRAVAVLGVLFAHAGEAVGTERFYYLGQAGVRLFFVHTALVLLWSLERLHRDGLGSPCSRFYAQRVFRIYPLYLAALVATLLIGVPWVDTLGGHPSAPWLGPEWLISNLLLVQNLTLSAPISAPMWSLAYEMQMYLVLPIVYLIVGRREALGRLMLISLAAVIVAIASMALLPRLYSPIYPPLAYFVPCFIAGALAFALSGSRPVLSSALFPVLLLMGISLYVYDPLPIFEWLGCTVLGLSLSSFREMRNRVGIAISHAIAKYSYAMYLAHWPLLWLWFRKAQGLDIDTRWLLFVLSLVSVCVLAFYLVERPMIQLGRRLAARPVRHESIVARGA